VFQIIGHALDHPVILTISNVPMLKAAIWRISAESRREVERAEGEIGKFYCS